MKKLLIIILTNIILFTTPGVVFAYESSFIYKGKIIEVEKKETKQINTTLFKAVVELSNGGRSGERIQIEQTTLTGEEVINYMAGDRIILTSSKGIDKKEVFYITDYDRSSNLILLVILFIFVTITVAGRHGWRALISMAISFLIITQVTIPLIVNGSNPIFVTLLTSIFLIPAIFYISHGFSRKANIAISGVFIAIVITIILTVIFTAATFITGLTDDNAIFLQFFSGGSFNLKNIYIAGVIISLSGILDDATISQVSIVKELRGTMKRGNAYELYTKAMNVGRDHISSMVNTLVLVYVGASLPLLIILTNSEYPFSQMINLEIMTEEIVRTLVGSIGLILAIPITTYIAARYYSKIKA